MEDERTEPEVQLLPLACRFVTYDQWLTTHVNASWKVKEVKLWILGKCLGVSLQSQGLPSISSNSTAQSHGASSRTHTPPPAQRYRPASPITFAPDPRQRPISPILFAKSGHRTKPKVRTPTRSSASGKTVEGDLRKENGDLEDDADDEEDVAGEGYEEDDEWDTADEGDDDDLGGTTGIAVLPKRIVPVSSSTPIPTATTSSMPNARPNMTSTVSAKFNTNTATYTLLRFSTGQILEDDFLLSWYTLSPYELLELHAHIPVETLPPYFTDAAKALDSHKHHVRNPSIYSTTTASNVPSAPTPPTTSKKYLPSLDRTLLSTYVLPYWEGYVRTLRVVWREEPLFSSGYGYAPPNTGYNNGNGRDGDKVLPSDWRRGRGGESTYGGFVPVPTRTTTLEWRMRWMVVKEGMLIMSRSRGDPDPTHILPLSALSSLRGAEHLSKSTHLTKYLNKANERRSFSETRKGQGHGYTSSMFSSASSSRHGHGSSHQGHGTSRQSHGSSPHGRPRSRTTTSHPRWDSDSDEDNPNVGMEELKGAAKGEGDLLGSETDGMRVVCIGFRSGSRVRAVNVAATEPGAAFASAIAQKRYASTLAGYGGNVYGGGGAGGVDGVTYIDAKGTTKWKGKEKELKGKDKSHHSRAIDKDRDGRLDKASLNSALAHANRGPYLRRSSISGAGTSTRTFIGGSSFSTGGILGIEADWFGDGDRDKKKDKTKEKRKGKEKGKGKEKEVDWARAFGIKGKGKSEKKGGKEKSASTETSTLVSSLHTTTSVSTYGEPISFAGFDSSDDDMEGELTEHDEEGMHDEGEGPEDVQPHQRTEHGREAATGGTMSDDGDDEGMDADTSGVITRPDTPLSDIPPKPQPVSGPHPQPELLAGSDSDGSLSLSSPVFAHSDRSCDHDEDLDCWDSDGCTKDDGKIGKEHAKKCEGAEGRKGMGCNRCMDRAGYRYGYRYGYQYESAEAARWGRQGGPVWKDDESRDDGDSANERVRERYREQELGKEKERDREKEREKEENERQKEQQNETEKEKGKGEWIVLDMGTDLAYMSLLRVLHRHFPPPISSSFMAAFPTFTIPSATSTPTPTPTPTPFPSPTSPRAFGSSSQNFQWTSPQDKDDSPNSNHHEPSSPVSTSSQSSRFQFNQPVHPPALATLSTISTSAQTTFGALPYPEWRTEVVERAQKAGMGDVGKVMRWVLWGSNNQLELDLEEARNRNKEGGVEDTTRKRRSTLKHRRPSTASHSSTITDTVLKLNLSYDSDLSEDTGKILEMSDSEEESDAEWQGWPADLHRQHKVQAQKAKEEAAAAQLPPKSEEEVREEAPKSPAEDQRRYKERRRALEPSGTVTTMYVPTPPSSSVISTPSQTLYSPSSSESLARRQRARALSFSPVDPSSSPPTTNPSSTHSHLQSPSPLTGLHRKLPPGSTLSHSTSLYASGLRPGNTEQSLRRPSMPILGGEQTLSTVLSPQVSILRSPETSTFSFPAPVASGSRSPPFSPSLSSTFGAEEDIQSGSATMPRRASSAGMVSPGGSLGRSSSVFGRSGGFLKKESAKDGDKARERDRERTKDKGKEKEKEKAKTDATEARKTRPKLSLATSNSSKIPPSLEPHSPQQAKSPTMEAARSILRRVRSGESLRPGMGIDEEPLSPTREGPSMVPGHRKKGRHVVERIVRGLDSALDFVDGK